ncbi:AAA family ATPase [Oceanithermus desulfurans]
MSQPGEVRLLGPPEVRVGGGWVPLAGRRRPAILAYLAVEGPSERTLLAELLWGNEHAMRNLRVELHRLEQRFPGLVVRRGSQLELGVAADVQAFEEALERADYARALELYRGRLLEGTAADVPSAFEDWLLIVRERLEERYVDALVAQAERLAGREPRAALALQRRVLERDPLREASCRAVMRLYAQLGEVRKALEFYEEYAAFLERELELPPVQETRLLAEELRTGKAQVRRWKRAPLAGRERELERMGQAWREGRHVVLLGEPGIGKTRLLHEFARSLGRRPLLLRGRPEDHAVPLATLARGLRVVLEQRDPLPDWARQELARVLPELGEPPSVPSPQRFLAAIGELLAPFADADWFWGVDDLQFFDEGSLELLMQLRSLGLMRPLAVAYRSGTLSPRAQTWIQSLVERQGAELVELEPLPLDAVARMFGDGAKPEDAWVRAVHRFTGGNPFFIVQLSESWRARGREPPEGAGPALSDRLYALLRQRIGAVPPRARSLLRLAAVAGEAYSPQLAGTVMGLAPLEVAEAADVLEYQGLFRRGRLAHDLVREATLRDLDPETVRALHAQVAEQIKDRAAPGLVAAHYEQAGMPERAVPLRLEAAAGAIRGFAYLEAFEQFHRAFELSQGEARARLIAQTLITRYRIGVATGDWPRLERELDLTEEAARELGDDYTLKNVRVGRVDLNFRRLDLDRAVRLGRRLLAEGGLTPDQEAMATYALAQALFFRDPDTHPEVARLCRRALALTDESWYMWGWPFTTLALCCIKGGELEEAEGWCARAEAHFGAADDLAGLATVQRTRALIAWWRGDAAAAAAAAEQALELARKADFRTIVFMALDTAVGLYRALGDEGRVRELTAEAERRGFRLERGDLRRLRLEPPRRPETLR